MFIHTLIKRDNDAITSKSQIILVKFNVRATRVFSEYFMAIYDTKRFYFTES